MLPVIVPDGHVEPALATHVHDPPVNAAGNVSVTVALLMMSSPALVATIVYCVAVPGVEVAVPLVLVICRSTPLHTGSSPSVLAVWPLAPSVAPFTGNSETSPLDVVPASPPFAVRVSEPEEIATNPPPPPPPPPTADS